MRRKKKSKGALGQSKEEKGQSTDDPNRGLSKHGDYVRNPTRGTSRALVCFRDGQPPVTQASPVTNHVTYLEIEALAIRHQDSVGLA